MSLNSRFEGSKCGLGVDDVAGNVYQAPPVPPDRVGRMDKVDRSVAVPVG